MNLDNIDRKIIELLRTDSRMTSSQIGKIVHLSVPAVSERIRKLEEERIIECFTLKINREKFNMDLLVFVSVIIDKPENIESFRAGILQNENVLECHHIAGEYDYLLKVAVRNTKELEEFISGTLKKMIGVAKTSTTVVLSSIKEEM